MKNEIDIIKYINLYLEEKISILNNYPIEQVEEAVKIIFNAYENSKTIFAMANGGNAGTVDHLYCDFTHHPFVSEDKSKGIDSGVKRLHFVNLCSSPSEITGLVNDFGAENMFSAALSPLLTKDDFFYTIA